MTGAEAQQRLATKTKLLYGVGDVGNLVALARSLGCYAEQVSVPGKVQPALE